MKKLHTLIFLGAALSTAFSSQAMLKGVWDSYFDAEEQKTPALPIINPVDPAVSQPNLPVSTANNSNSSWWVPTPVANVTDGVKEFAEAAKTISEGGLKVQGAEEAGAGIKNIGLAAKKLSEDGFKADSKTLDSFNQATASINKTSASMDKVSHVFDEIHHDGLKISNSTIKTLFTSGIGLALAITGLALIYNELTQKNSEAPTNQTTITPKQSYKESLKNLLKSKYFMGTSSLAAGLLLIVFSDKVAQSV